MCNKRRFLSSAVLLIGLGTGCGSSGSTPDLQVYEGGRLDLSIDLYHRAKSRLLDLDREPLVCQVHPLAPEIKSDITHVTFETEIGGIRVRTKHRGEVIVYMDPGARWSHPEVSAWPPGFGIERVFPDDPIHPVSTTLVLVTK